MAQWLRKLFSDESKIKNADGSLFYGYKLGEGKNDTASYFKMEMCPTSPSGFGSQICIIKIARFADPNDGTIHIIAERFRKPESNELATNLPDIVRNVFEKQGLVRPDKDYYDEDSLSYGTNVLFRVKPSAIAKISELNYTLHDRIDALLMKIETPYHATGSIEKLIKLARESPQLKKRHEKTLIAACTDYYALKQSEEGVDMDELCDAAGVEKGSVRETEALLHKFLLAKHPGDTASFYHPSRNPQESEVSVPARALSGRRRT